MKETAAYIKLNGRYLSQKTLMDKEETARLQQMGLMQALHFSDKDLDANSDNQLSRNQRLRLRQYQILGALSWWVLAGFGVFLLLLSNSRQNARHQLLILAVIALGIGMAFWQQYQTNQALKDNSVDVITAEIRTTKQYENNSTIYRAFLGEKKFEISQTTYEQLVPGQYYSFYYVPQTGKLLTIEVTLTPEEKRLMEVAHISAREKQKRLAEPDEHQNEFNTEEDIAAPKYLSQDK